MTGAETLDAIRHATDMFALSVAFVCVAVIARKWLR